MHSSFSLSHVVAYAAIASFICNAVLAYVTKNLAASTKALADSGDKTVEAALDELELLKTQTQAAQDQSAAAQEALHSSIRPLLMDVPPFTMQPRALTADEQLAYRNKPSQTPPYVIADASPVVVETQADGAKKPLLRVPVRNIGAGPAVMTAARLADALPDLRGVPTANGVMQGVVAPGQIVSVEFEHQEPTPGWLEDLLTTNRVLVVELTYTDIADRQETSTRLFISRDGNDPDSDFAVRRVEPLRPPQLYEPPLPDLPAKRQA